MCEECKDCWNYKVSEIGCYGSDKPCEYYTGEDRDEIREKYHLDQHEKEKNK